MKPINQSINLTSIAESKSVYDTSKPHLIYPEGSPIIPFQRLNLALKNSACNLVSWESKTRVNKVSPIPAIAGLGEMLGEKKKENAQN